MPYGRAPGGPVAPVISLANTLAAFAAFQARNFAGVPAVDRDPESYIRQAEQGLPARATGSLNIGSLKGQ